MATYSVFIPAPKGHTGELPVTIGGTNKKGEAVHYSVRIPFDTEVSGVPEAVAKYVEENHGANISLEKEKAKPAEGGKKAKKDTPPAEGSETPAGDGQ